jgi:hypothetical protein
MYQVSLTNQKKKHDTSKYSYKSIEQGTHMFIFEILLKDKNNEEHILRKIKKSHQGKLITLEDNLKYKNINIVKVAVMDVNNTNFEISADIEIDQHSTYTTYVSNELYLEFVNNNTIECTYNIPIYE